MLLKRRCYGIWPERAGERHWQCPKNPGFISFLAVLGRHSNLPENRLINSIVMIKHSKQLFVK